MNKDTIKTVLDWPDQKALVMYMHGLLTAAAALVCIRTELPNCAARTVCARLFGQHTIFFGIRAPETQLHLRLGPRAVRTCILIASKLC